MDEVLVEIKNEENYPKEETGGQDKFGNEVFLKTGNKVSIAKSDDEE